MIEYLRLLEELLHMPEKQTRTGVDTNSKIFNYMSFDLENNRFPAITTKPFYKNACFGELISFIAGHTNAADFRANGCNVWNANANETSENVDNAWLSSPYRKGQDDLGRIYGAQWRNWDTSLYLSKDEVLGIGCKSSYNPNDIHDCIPVVEGLTGYDYMGYLSVSDLYVFRKKIDQLKQTVNKLIFDPFDRRIIISAWNPGELDRMALPPCHILMHWLVSKGKGEYKLNLIVYQRSADVMLGIPFNIASYAAFVHIMARITGYLPGFLHYITGDTHLYKDHQEAAREQLRRVPINCNTKLVIAEHLRTLEDFEKAVPEDFKLIDYKHHDRLSNPTEMLI